NLAALFWPDQPDELALSNLAQALVRLRGALGNTSALLDRTRHAIQWRGAAAAVDVIEFRRLARSAEPADLARAAELYRGEFLAGSSVAGRGAFGEGLLVTREQFAQQALTALHTLAEQEVATGHFDEAAQAARRKIDLDPWREEAQRQLMRALAGAG